uniref:Uncharacterized protein n=1 Tax=Strix occidentalis caurina TaxID=311401 RepID=A0A8D0F2Z8_STROC
MASLLQSERVLYLVRGEKEMRAPLSQLYFCRYCSELRSLECVSHEVTAARLFPPGQAFPQVIQWDFCCGGFVLCPRMAGALSCRISSGCQCAGACQECCHIEIGKIDFVEVWVN